MSKEDEEIDQGTHQFQMKYLFLLFPLVIIWGIAILAASIYLFLKPGVISGIVFALVMLILVVLPLTMILIFYFKKLKKSPETDLPKQKVMLEKNGGAEKREPTKSRIELLEK